jgi:hypothetical protein
VIITVLLVVVVKVWLEVKDEVEV